MLATRVNQFLIFDSFSRPFITAVLGPRRVGKSTLVSFYIQKNPDFNWVVLNMDNWEEKARVERLELHNLIQEKAEKQISPQQKIWVAIDEAQKCPALFEQIKLLYDEYKDTNSLKFILTGSGFLSLHQMSAESLAGRIELYHLREFNLQETLALTKNNPTPTKNIFEFLSKADISISDLKQFIDSRTPFRPDIERVMRELIIWGGLPEVLVMPDKDTKRNYLSNYLQTYFEKDIRAIATITDLNLFRRLMEVTAEQTGTVRDDKKILETLNCSRDTLKKYRGFLTATLLYQEIYPFIGSLLKRLIKSPKGYLLDNGIISFLSGIDELFILEKTGLIGHRFEAWFLKEIATWLDRETKHHEIYYWRTSSGIEVDFVIERKPEIFPFEITYSKMIQAKKIKNLKTFLQQEPRAKVGFYVYLGEFKYDSENKIYFLPAWAFG